MSSILSQQQGKYLVHTVMKIHIETSAKGSWRVPISSRHQKWLCSKDAGQDRLEGPGRSCQTDKVRCGLKNGKACEKYQTKNGEIIIIVYLLHPKITLDYNNKDFFLTSVIRWSGTWVRYGLRLYYLLWQREFNSGLELAINCCVPKVTCITSNYTPLADNSNTAPPNK